MPTSLRARFAFTIILGVFLIPTTLSSLRGLTHVITCAQPNTQPFTISTSRAGASVITSSAVLTRARPAVLCGGLVLNIGVRSERPGFVRVVMPITNRSKFTWRGTVRLAIGRASVPISVGEIRPRSTTTRTVEVRVKAGETHLDGRLLVGP